MGNVSVSSPSILNNRTTVTLRGGLTGSGSWRNDNGSVLNYERTLAPAISNFIVNTNSNLVNYSLSGDQEVRSASYHHLQTGGSGVKTLQGAVTVNGNLSIGTGTTFNTGAGNYGIILNGSWINDGTFDEMQGTVSFKGTGAQSVINSISPAETFYNLELNTTGPVTSNINLAVKNVLTMTNGVIIMPGKLLTLGLDALNPGSLTYTSGWITGSFSRWVVPAFNAMDVILPVGTLNYNRKMTFNFPDITAPGVLTANFDSSVPTTGGLPLFENIYYLNQLFPEGYWNVTRDAAFTFAGTFDLKLVPSGFSTYPIDAETRIVSRLEGGNWYLNGNHSPGSVSQVGRNGLAGFTNNYAVTYSEVCQATFLNCPSDITVTSLPGQCNNIVTWVPPTMSIPCPTYTITNNYNPGDVFNVGTTQVVYKLMNGPIVADFCSFNIIVTDTLMPVITCAGNQTRNVDIGACDYTVTGTEMDPVFTFSNCPFTLTNDLNGEPSLSGVQIPVGTTTVLWTISGLSGTSTSCSMDIVIIDNILPTLTPVANRIEYVGSSCSFTIQDYRPLTIINDNCGTPELTQTPVIGTIISGAGTIQPITITATDESGNSSSTTFNITLADNTPPIPICKNITKALDASGNVSIVASDVDNGSTDNCGIALLSINKNSFTCSDIGTNNVIMTVTDASGNSATCAATVTITDNQVPAITCPSNISQNTDAGLCSASVVVPNAVTSDNCSVTTLTWAMTGATVAASPAAGINQVGTHTFNSGITTVTYTVKDGSGNQSVCSFTVTVTDNQIPAITCPSNISQNADAGLCSASVVVPNAVTSDNCSVTILTWAMTGATVAASPAAGINQVGTHTFNSGITTVTYTVKDGSGNQSVCSFTVTVTDNQIPAITCPSNISQSADAGLCSASVVVPNAVTSDNCSVTSLTWAMTGATVAASPAAGINQVGTYTFNSGITTVTYTVKDGSGNQSVCSFTVTVTDNQVPVITCPPDISQNAGAGLCTASVAVTNATISDNCSVTSLTWAMTGATVAASPAAGINQVGTYTFNPGITTITYTVKDGSGNQAVCNFTVTVTDNQVPAITCPSNISQNTDAGVCSASVVVPNAVTSDNCSVTSLTWAMTGATVAASPAAGINQVGTYTFNSGITTVTYTVKDGSGNQSVCTFTVTVTDNQIPVNHMSFGYQSEH